MVFLRLARLEEAQTLRPRKLRPIGIPVEGMPLPLLGWLDRSLS